MERRRLLRVPFAGARPERKQDLDTFGLLGERCDRESILAELVESPEIRSAVDERLRNFEAGRLASGGTAGHVDGGVKRIPAVRVRCIALCPGCEEDADDRSRAGHHERSPSQGVALVRVRAGLEQQAHAVRGTRSRSAHERPLGLISGRGGRRAALEEERDPRRVPCLARLAQEGATNEIAFVRVEAKVEEKTKPLRMIRRHGHAVKGPAPSMTGCVPRRGVRSLRAGTDVGTMLDQPAQRLDRRAIDRPCRDHQRRQPLQMRSMVVLEVGTLIDIRTGSEKLRHRLDVADAGRPMERRLRWTRPVRSVLFAIVFRVKQHGWISRMQRTHSATRRTQGSTEHQTVRVSRRTDGFAGRPVSS
jgi:hypothetical protein